MALAASMALLLERKDYEITWRELDILQLKSRMAEHSITEHALRA